MCHLSHSPLHPLPPPQLPALAEAVGRVGKNGPASNLAPEQRLTQLCQELVAIGVTFARCGGEGVGGRSEGVGDGNGCVDVDGVLLRAICDVFFKSPAAAASSDEGAAARVRAGPSSAPAEGGGGAAAIVADSVASVSVSSDDDPLPPTWKNSFDLAAPSTVGSLSCAAALGFVTGVPRFPAAGFFSRALSSLADVDIDAAAAAVDSLWQRGCVVAVPIDRVRPALDTLTFDDFNPYPQTFHALCVMLNSYCVDDVRGGAGAGAAPRVGEWYGGCRTVPRGVVNFRDLLSLVDGEDWTGLILCIHLPSAAFYVAFCLLPSGWCFFDPDVGVYGPLPSTRAPPLPDGVLALVVPELRRTLFRFKHAGPVKEPTPAAAAVRHCFNARFAKPPSRDDGDMADGSHN